jgi:hypothetical protein
VLVNPITPFVAAYAIPCNLYLNVFMAAALALTAYYKNPVIPIVSLFVVFALTYGRLEKFLSPRARESDSVTARG